MNEEQVRKIAEDVYNRSSNQKQFTVVPTSLHTHTGKDSNRVEFINLKDAPRSYSGYGGYSVVVNSTENALTFSQNSLNVAIGYGTCPASPGTTVVTTNFLPKLIRVNAYFDGTGVHAHSIGSSTGASSGQYIYVYAFGTNTYDSLGSSTAGILEIFDTSGNSVCYATVSAVDATSFTLNWSTTTNRANYQWEAIG